MVNDLPIPVVCFFILQHSNQSGQGLIIIMSWKVVPTQQNLWCLLCGVRARCHSFIPPFSWVHGYTLILLRHPRPEPTTLNHSPSHPPSNRPWWTYYGLLIFWQERSYAASLRALFQQMFFSTFLSYLNRLHIVVYQSSWTTRGLHLLASARLRLNSISIRVIFDARITIQIRRSTPARYHFWRLGSFILEFISLRFLAVYVNNRKGARYCCTVTMGLPLNTRSQHGTKRKRKSPSSPPSQSLAQQIKKTCVTITIFCIFASDQKIKRPNVTQLRKYTCGPVIS
ncbi:uncharacterized protein LOC122733961 [Dromiciops gliroides]|uniref:uncharacterized protein LOC122733961 n=1 Tax=Dromiciops gliroides TaxID=33562 RepID=UPI001CC41EB4|nr:uncharacterized protein LOC122733961 [Dromiciops gliroides]